MYQFATMTHSFARLREVFGGLAFGAIALAAVAGCATTGGGVGSDTITQIQNAAIKACSFLPTVTTITAILGLHNPTYETVSDIASAICKAVVPAPTPNPLSRTAKPAAPTVAGVPIDGQFVTAK